jgi:uncharacterized protein (DUF58 family)
MDTSLTGRQFLTQAQSAPLSASTSAGSACGADGALASHRLRFRRVFILPTRQGMGFALAVSVMLLGSINYDNALGYVLSFMLVGVSLISMLHAVRNLAGLRLSHDQSEPVFAHDQARFGLRVDNRGQRQRFGLLARLNAGSAGSRGDDAVVHFPVQADSVARITLTGVAAHRGWFNPGPVTIATRFPFGLFRAWSRVDVGLGCLVYPRPQGDQPLPECPPADSGEQDTAGKGEDEFSGLREYQQGDSAQRVHWKAVARGQDMPVKVFSGASAGVAQLRWQDVAAAEGEARLSQLCRWVLDADDKHLRYGLCLPGLELPPDNGESHRRRCLEALALYDHGAHQ